MSDWQDISTAPKDGSHVLVYWPELDALSPRVIGWWTVNYGWQCEGIASDIQFGGPTLWTPLPPLPPQNLGAPR